MYRLTITLRDGTTQTHTVKKMPRHWKSWLMQKLPYGSDKFSAQFKREKIED